MTAKDVLPEKDMFGKAAAMKKFEHSPISSELKKQTDIAKKQYQRLDKVYEFDQKESDETIVKMTKKQHNITNQI